MKIYIKGFAEKQNAIETALSNERTNKLIIHMLCIILAPHSSCVSHWIDEIHGFISNVTHHQNRFISGHMEKNKILSQMKIG